MVQVVLSSGFKVKPSSVGDISFAGSPPARPISPVQPSAVAATSTTLWELGKPLTRTIRLPSYLPGQSSLTGGGATGAADDVSASGAGLEQAVRASRTRAAQAIRISTP